MFRLFKHPFPIAINISDHSVEMIQLKKSKHEDVFDILAYSRGVIPAGIVLRGKVIKKERLIQELSNLIKSPTWGKYIGHDCVLSIPSSQVYTSIRTFSNIHSINNFSERILRESADIFPVSIPECSINWEMTKKGEEGIVYLTAVHKDILQTYQELLRGVSLNPILFEPEALSLRRGVLVDEHLDETFRIFIHMGAHSTLLSFSSKNGVYVNRVLDFGGFDFTKYLANKLNVSLKKAEKMKRRYGFSPDAHDGRLFLISQSAVQPLIEELMEIVKYFKENYSYDTQQIIFSGGGALMPGLIDYIASNLGINSILGSVRIKTIPKLDKNLRVLLSEVVGLALRTFDMASSKDKIDLLR